MKSLERMREKGIEPAVVAGDPDVNFDWNAFVAALGLDADGREYFETKQLGLMPDFGPRTEAVRASVGRRVKKAKSAGLKRSDFEVPVRGGDSRHLLYLESLPGGRKVLALSQLGAAFAEIMGAELQNIFAHSRTKRPSLRGSSRSAEKMQYSDIKLEVKNLTDQGTFEGDLAVYSNVDYGGDAILPGAFKKTLSENQGKVAPFHEPRYRRSPPKNRCFVLDGLSQSIEGPRCSESRAHQCAGSTKYPQLRSSTRLKNQHEHRLQNHSRKS